MNQASRIIRILSYILMLVAALLVAGCSSLGKGPGSFDGGDKLSTNTKSALTLGQAEQGNIATQLEADNWTFDGKKGQNVTIVVNGKGKADPHVVLFDPSGAEVGNDDDSGGGANALLSAGLPADGIYTVRIDMMIEPGEYTIVIR